MKIAYVRKGKFKPEKVMARPTVMPNMALRATAKDLPRDELTKKASKHLADTVFYYVFRNEKAKASLERYRKTLGY